MNTNHQLSVYRFRWSSDRVNTWFRMPHVRNTTDKRIRTFRVGFIDSWRSRYDYGCHNIRLIKVFYLLFLHAFHFLLSVTSFKLDQFHLNAIYLIACAGVCIVSTSVGLKIDIPAALPDTFDLLWPRQPPGCQSVWPWSLLHRRRTGRVRSDLSK